MPNKAPDDPAWNEMLSGALYDPAAPILVAGRHAAKKKCRKFNDTDGDPHDLGRPAMKQQRLEILNGLLGSLTSKCYIEPPFYCDYGANIYIGDEFYANHGTVILDCGVVTIGDRVMFGPNVQIYAAGHPTDVEERRRGDEFGMPVTIGNDVWIGGQVCVLLGVTIGDGVTVAAGAVVNKSVPGYCVVAGSPCRIVKKLKGFVEPDTTEEVMKTELK